MYLDKELRDASRTEFESEGINVGTDTRRFVAQRRVLLLKTMARKEKSPALVAQKKAGAEKAADDWATEERATDEQPAEDKIAEGNATEEQPVESKKEPE